MPCLLWRQKPKNLPISPGTRQDHWGTMMVWMKSLLVVLSNTKSSRRCFDQQTQELHFSGSQMHFLPGLFALSLTRSREHNFSHDSLKELDNIPPSSNLKLNIRCSCSLSMLLVTTTKNISQRPICLIRIPEISSFPYTLSFPVYSISLTQRTSAVS